jgi:glycosyltransferase involved in cell wall biosynthesis
MEVCVVIPAYDNARTLEAVVRGAREHGTRVIVVDDGSRDETAEILARVEGIEVARHERNRGKGRRDRGRPT